MRAYPANAKNSSPAACSTPATVTSSPITGRQPSASPKPTMMTTTAVSTDQHHRHDHAGEQRRALDAGVVDRRQRHHRRNRDGMRLGRPQVVTDGERHRRTRRGLADDEAPSRGVSPEFAEPLAAVRRRCRRTADSRRPAGPTTWHCSRRRRPRPPDRGADRCPPRLLPAPAPRKYRRRSSTRARSSPHRRCRSAVAARGRPACSPRGCYVRPRLGLEPATRAPTSLPPRPANPAA